jgi:hypothetical protein
VHAELAHRGVHVGGKRVARLMHAAGLVGYNRRQFRGLTRQDPQAAPAPDLVDCQFVAAAPNQLWCSDVTYGHQARATSSITRAGRPATRATISPNPRLTRIFRRPLDRHDQRDPERVWA